MEGPGGRIASFPVFAWQKYCIISKEGMKKLILILTAVCLNAQVSNSAPPKIPASTCPGDEVQIMAYLPPGTNPQRVTYPVCIKLGPEFKVEEGQIKLAVLPPNQQLISVSTFQEVSLSDYGTPPTDGSDWVITVNLRDPVYPNSAILYMFRGDLWGFIETYNDPPGNNGVQNTLTFRVNQIYYSQPNETILIMYSIPVVVN